MPIHAPGPPDHYVIALVREGSSRFTWRPSSIARSAPSSAHNGRVEELYCGTKFLHGELCEASLVAHLALWVAVDE